MGLLMHNVNESPPGGFRYRVPETGMMFKDFTSLYDLQNALVKHYSSNGLSVPANLPALIQDQLCLLIPPERCYSDDPSVRSWAYYRLTFEEILSGTTNLVGWQLKGRPKVSEEESNRRALICASGDPTVSGGRCRCNIDPTGCPSCNSSLHTIVNAFVGNRPTQHDAKLGGCFVCGCSLKSLIQMPAEIVVEHLSDEQKQALPEHCWQK
jgi:hypothetical protein